MTQIHITTQEWRLDLLAKHLFGSAYHGNVEALLVANPGLSLQGQLKGQFIKAGTVLSVPKPLSAKPIVAVNPWD